MTLDVEPPTREETLIDLVRSYKSGHTLETPFYTSRSVFDLDMAAIFERHWLFVAAEGEIPEPGDFVTVDVGAHSVIIVRDDEGQLRAFHNVCRHRGSRILDDTRGTVGHLVCPYHHWIYGVDGCLRHADNQAEGFDPSRYRLGAVNVRSLAGLVFICLAPDPPDDFDDVASQLTPYLAPYGLARTKVAHTTDLIEEGNWKLVMENNRECYHCEGHPELLSAYFPLHGYTEEDVPPRLRPVWLRFDKARTALRAACRMQDFPMAAIRELDSRATGFLIAHAPLDGAGKSYSANGQAVCSTLLGSMRDDRFGDLHLHIQPNSWFHLLADHAVVFSVLPVAPERTLLRCTWLVHEDAVAGADYDEQKLAAIWTATNAQDSVFVARTQRGVRDPGYRPGPYSEVEEDVAAFVTWYINRLSDYFDNHAQITRGHRPAWIP